MNWAVVVACGPTDGEVERVGDLLESVFHHEPRTAWAAVIDSGHEDRRLGERFGKPAGATLVGVRNPPAGRAGGQWGPLCAGILSAYDWVVRKTDARFVAKFDSDALVIAPFAEQILRGVSDNPTAAIFGSYKIDCNGQRRDTNGWAAMVQRLHKLVLFEYQPERYGRRFPVALFGRPAGMRRHIGDALRNGYEPGEHVSGGAYAATRELLDRMTLNGYLAQPDVWADSQMSEDVMMCIYARACGLGIAPFNADGQTFGVKHVGLPDTPDRLLARGYSIIHSVKSDTRFTEEQIRAFFRQERRQPGSGVLPTAAAATVPAAPVASSQRKPTSQVDDLDEEVALGF